MIQKEPQTIVKSVLEFFTIITKILDLTIKSQYNITMIINEIIDIDQMLWEMAKLGKNITGLPMNIFVSSKDYVKDKHGPRIKVMFTHANRFHPDELSSVSISNNPKDFHEKLSNKDFKEVSKFIQRNEKALLMFWNEEIDIRDLLNILEIED